MTLDPMRRRVVRVVLRIYPRWWRERYAEELLDLVDRQPLTVRTLFDVCRGATRERLASSLTWQVGATALLTGAPFLVMFCLLPVAMTGRMMWGDPLLSLLVDPRPLGQLWLTPLVIAVGSNLVLRRAASRVSMSWKTAALSALFCAVAGHGVLLASAFADGRAGEFLPSAAWWQEVYPQVLWLYAGFGTVGIIAHRLIAAPGTRGIKVAPQ